MLCEEAILPWEDRSPTNLPMHQECGLREVLGGIGHLTDHAYWCRTVRDPDMGLPYRQSARLVLEWVNEHGVEAAVERG